MNDTLIANICTILSTMKADQKWTPAHDEAFLVGLEDLPDEAGQLLRREILKQFDWRPSVKDVRDLWAKISQPKPLAADELVARMYIQRDRRGPYVVPDPNLPGVMRAGEPVYTDMNLKRLVLARGGWVQFCAEESNSTNAAQLLKLATVILGGASDAAINTLRLEYLAANPPALTAPLPALTAEYTDAPSPVDSYPSDSRGEAAQVMARVQSRTSGLRMVRTGEQSEEAA